jgi:hypothetical protein
MVVKAMAALNKLLASLGLTGLMGTTWVSLSGQL